LEIGYHTGDNPHADIKSARAHGISARYTETSKLNNVESFLKTAGQLQLCKAIRELRLSHHDENPLLQTWAQTQFNYNIPLLALSAFHIFRECKRLDRDKVLFSSRDCYFLKKVFQGMSGASHKIGSLYFYTSRLARLSKSDDYAHYVRNCLSGKALIVDLCGTGWSINAMLDHVGVSAPFSLMHDLSAPDMTAYFTKIRNVTANHERSCLFKGPGIDNIFFEKMNYVNHGMILDVKYIPDLNQYVPIQKPPGYPAEIMTYISITEALIDRFIHVLRSYDLDEMFSEVVSLGDNFQEVFKAIYCAAAADVKFSAGFDRYHGDDNDDVIAELCRT
jgi:hypothetical protein